MTAQIRQASFSLTLPSLGEPDSNSALELLLLSLPGQLLFVLAGCFTHRRRLLIGVFLLAASITALLQCLVFAGAAAHPHAPDPERAGFQLRPHQGNDVGLGQAKLRGNRFKRGVVLPGHRDDARDVRL